MNKKVSKESLCCVFFGSAMLLLIPSFANRCLFTVLFFHFAACSEFGLNHDRVKTETTLAIIKPDGVYGNHIDAVKKAILDSGFHIVREMKTQLDEDTVKSFYAEHSSKSFFSSLIQYMTSGPVLIMELQKENAIADWRKLIGPNDANKAKSTHPHRAMCGIDAEKNCVHGSDSASSAEKEINFFFSKAAEL
ncbi:hypothetical protein V2J09_023430 [Rumex salicifolius]